MLVEKFSAVLRKAGYRSSHLEDVHISEPRCWLCRTPTGQLLEPPTRAKEIRLDLWCQLQFKIDSHHRGVALARRGRDPVGGLFTWRVATNFLLRELELALLDLHLDTISFDVLAGTVTVCLSADATNSTGCLPCSVLVGHGNLDKFWRLWRSVERGGNIVTTHCQDSRCFVGKTHMIHVLKSDASVVVDQHGAKFDTSHVTGHEMRRAGAKHQA